MEITLTLSADDRALLEELRDALKEAKPAARKPRTTRKKKDEPAPEPELEAAPEPEAEEDDFADLDAPEKTWTQDEVRKILKEYAKIEGKDAAIKIINDHGAESIAEIDADKYQSVVDATGLKL